MQAPVMSPSELALIAVLVACLIATLMVFMAFVLLFRHWIKAFMNGAPVSIFAILGMLLRGNPRSTLIDAFIQLSHRGSPATIKDVELAYIDNRHRIRNSHDLVGFVEERLDNDATASGNGK
jgi:uncharacterized protein YqfA (UPF0365 family)